MIMNNAQCSAATFCITPIDATSEIVSAGRHKSRFLYAATVQTTVVLGR